MNKPKPAQTSQRSVDGVVRPAARPSTASENGRKLSRKRLITVVVTLLALLTLLAGAWYAWANVFSQVDSSRYQAVILNNNQVYFGKLHAYGTSHPYLTDVHYFQASSVNDTSSNKQLVTLGDEVHGPDNKLILNPNSILFVENLKEDSNVAQAIKKGKTDAAPQVQTTIGR